MGHCIMQLMSTSHLIPSRSTLLKLLGAYW